MSWKALARSAIGTSHQSKKTPCQDYGNYLIIDNIIIGAVSDGMGSAKYSDIGSQLTVKTTLNFLEKVVNNWQKKKDNLQLPITEQEANKVFLATLNNVISCLSEEAIKGYELKDFACTLIAFVATPHWLIAMQIGDGFMVVKENNENYHLLLSGEKGEYANITTSVISNNAREKMQVKVLSGDLTFICASTDGLETVAIDRRKWIPADIFFEPLEEYMRVTIDPEKDDQYIVKFLNSDRLNDNTNDDKTLLICLFERKQEPTKSQPQLKESLFAILCKLFFFNILAGCFLYNLIWNYDYKKDLIAVVILSFILVVNFGSFLLSTRQQLHLSWKPRKSLFWALLTSATGITLGYLIVWIL